MPFVKVAAVKDIPKGKMKGFTVNGKKLLVANIDGKLHAIGSVCTHAKGPLEQGVLKDKEVMCPWHGSKFDCTSGKATHGPAKDAEPVYKVKVEGNDILVEA